MKKEDTPKSVLFDLGVLEIHAADADFRLAAYGFIRSFTIGDERKLLAGREVDHFSAKGAS